MFADNSFAINICLYYIGQVLQDEYFSLVTCVYVCVFLPLFIVFVVCWVCLFFGAYFSLGGAFLLF